MSCDMKQLLKLHVATKLLLDLMKGNVACEDPQKTRGYLGGQQCLDNGEPFKTLNLAVLPFSHHIATLLEVYVDVHLCHLKSPACSFAHQAAAIQFVGRVAHDVDGLGDVHLLTVHR